GLWLAGVLLLLRAGRRTAERLRASGLGLFLAGLLGLALAVGWGRSGFGPGSGLKARYVSLMTPALCCLYFVVALYTGPAAAARAQAGLALLAGLVLLLNAQPGLTLAEAQRQVVEAFERDLDAGLPPFVLADRYSRFPLQLYPDPARFTAYLPLLRQARVG